MGLCPSAQYSSCLLIKITAAVYKYGLLFHISTVPLSTETKSFRVAYAGLNPSLQQNSMQFAKNSSVLDVKSESVTYLALTLLTPSRAPKAADLITMDVLCQIRGVCKVGEFTVTGY
jgi:hypothetical protein